MSLNKQFRYKVIYVYADKEFCAHTRMSTFEMAVTIAKSRLKRSKRTLYCKVQPTRVLFTSEIVSVFRDSKKVTEPVTNIARQLDALIYNT